MMVRERCRACNGRGVVLVHRQRRDDPRFYDPHSRPILCTRCNGDGLEPLDTEQGD